MIKLNQKLKDALWWLVISVDYDYSRISIADHEINGPKPSPSGWSGRISKILKTH